MRPKSWRSGGARRSLTQPPVWRSPTAADPPQQSSGPCLEVFVNVLTNVNVCRSLRTKDQWVFFHTHVYSGNFQRTDSTVVKKKQQCSLQRAVVQRDNIVCVHTRS